jgi:hypothetical protein
MAQNLRLEYALPVNKEFSVSVGKVLLIKLKMLSTPFCASVNYILLITKGDPQI